MLVQKVLGVESNLLGIIHAGVKSGNLRILLHFVGHTHVWMDEAFGSICQRCRDQL